MLEIVLSFLTLIQTGIMSTFNMFNIFVEPNNNIEINEELVYQYKDYSVVLEGENYVVKGENVNITIEKFPRLIEYNDKLYIVYSDETCIKGYVLDREGKIDREIYEVLEGVTNDFTLHIFNDSIYMVGNHLGENRITQKEVDSNNIFIYDLIKNDCRIYGGLYSERYICSYVDAENIYVCLLKDKNCYGDFGNSGQSDKNIMICLFNNDLELVDKTTLNIEEDVVDMKKNGSFILLKTNLNIYYITLDLKQINKLDISNYSFVYVGNDLLVLYDGEYLEVVNIYDLEKLDKIIWNNDGKFLIFNNQIILKKDKYYYFDIVDLRRFKSFDEYYKNIDDKDTVYTLYGKARLIDEKCNDYFDGLKYGEYSFDLAYESINGVIFNLSHKQKVSLKVNVLNGQTYYSGYRIIANGVMYLDGKLIVNNYPVYDMGEYELVIEGNGVKEVLKFNIGEFSGSYSDQIYSDYDYKYTKEEDIVISYNFNKNVEINDIVCNKEVDDYSIIEKNNKYILMIFFKNDGVLKEENIYIDYIDYTYEENNFIEIVNKVYRIIITESKPDILIANFKNEDCSFIINSDDDGLLRYLDIEVYDKGIVFNKIIPVSYSEKSIVIEGIKNDNVTIDVSLCYYNGSSYSYVKICELKIKETSGLIDIGSIYENNNDDSRVIKLSFNKDSGYIDEIHINNIVVYKDQKTSVLKNIIIILFCFSLSVGVTIVIGIIKNKRKLYKTKNIEK